LQRVLKYLLTTCTHALNNARHGWRQGRNYFQCCVKRSAGAVTECHNLVTLVAFVKLSKLKINLYTV